MHPDAFLHHLPIVDRVWGSALLVMEWGGWGGREEWVGKKRFVLSLNQKVSRELLSSCSSTEADDVMTLPITSHFRHQKHSRDLAVFSRRSQAVGEWQNFPNWESRGTEKSSALHRLSKCFVMTFLLLNVHSYCPLQRTHPQLRPLCFRW